MMFMANIHGSTMKLRGTLFSIKHRHWLQMGQKLLITRLEVKDRDSTRPRPESPQRPV